MLQKLEEHFLFILVIAGMTGCKFARPINGQPHFLQLRSHCCDIFVCPFSRMDLLFHGGVLCRHAESVPPHRVQDVESLGSFIARDNIAHGVISNMTHVNTPRRIREHFEDIIFRFVGVDVDIKAAGFVPALLPLGFSFFNVISGRRGIARHI